MKGIEIKTYQIHEDRSVEMSIRIDHGVINDLGERAIVAALDTIKTKLETELYEQIKDKFMEKYTEEIKEEIVEKALRDKLKDDLFGKKK